MTSISECDLIILVTYRPFGQSPKKVRQYRNFLNQLALFQHGMGGPSLSIMIIEIIKLLHYANAKNVTFFRLGTSGGLGVPPGTVLISSGAVNGEMQEYHIQYIMGKKVGIYACLLICKSST